MPPAERLPRGSAIGIVGGGQLGRMLAQAAAKLGFKASIFSPETDSPAFDVAAFRHCAAYDDAEALAKFATEADVVTFEFENIPVGRAGRHRTAVPGVAAPARAGSVPKPYRGAAVSRLTGPAGGALGRSRECEALGGAYTALAAEARGVRRLSETCLAGL